MACTKQVSKCLEHQCMCRYVCYRGFFDKSVHICKQTLRIYKYTRAYAPRIRAVFPLALGDEGRGVQLIYAGYLLLAWGVLLTCVKTKVLSEFSLILDRLNFSYRSH